MKKKRWKRVLLWCAGGLLLAIVALATHIYFALRPRVDSNTRIMARIDIRQPISRSESEKISTWLYSQQGVDHVLCSPQSQIVVFTYSPLLGDVNKISEEFRSVLNYKNSKRYIPDEAELKGSCPVASGSFSYKVYKFMKNIF